MPEDRTRPPFRPGGRRPIRLAGHRRRDGEQAPNEQPVGEQPIGEQPVGEQPIGEQPVGEQPIGEQAVGEQAVGEQAVGDQAVGEPTAAERAAGDRLPGADAPPPAEPVPPAVAEPGTPAAESAPAASGLSSAPLSGEPWAGLPAAPADRSTVDPRLRWLLLGLAALALVLLAVVTVLEYAHVQRVNRIASARSSALAAATRAGKPLLSYDYRTLDQQVQMTDPLLTPAYRTKYEATINNVVRTLAVPNKAVLTADVKVAGVRDVTQNAASVLLYADLSSTNNQRPDTRVDHTPLVVCMVRSGGNWLVDDVETKLGFHCGASAAQPGTPIATPSPPAASSSLPTPAPTPPSVSSKPAPPAAPKPGAKTTTPR